MVSQYFWNLCYQKNTQWGFKTVKFPVNACMLSSPCPEAVDGYWSCWSSWSVCDSTLKRHRTRSCNNPASQKGGKPCQGPKHQEEECTISIFQQLVYSRKAVAMFFLSTFFFLTQIYASFYRRDVCITDEEFESEGDSESILPPGVSGCTKPKPPSNSYLRVRSLP